MELVAEGRNGTVQTLKMQLRLAMKVLVGMGIIRSRDPRLSRVVLTVAYLKHRNVCPLIEHLSMMKVDSEQLACWLLDLRIQLIEFVSNELPAGDGKSDPVLLWPV